MCEDAFQLRLWSPVARQHRTLEIDWRWEETGPNDHTWKGWYAFWHGDTTPRSFDMQGRELGSDRTIFDMFHEAGCVAPSDLTEMVRTAFKYAYSDKQTLADSAARLNELLNELNASRENLRTYFP